MTGNKNYCIVCSNYAGKIVEGRKVTMHRIPRAKILSRIWCSRLQLVRKDLKPGQLKGRGNTRVCSEHFLWKKGPQPGDDIPSVFANRTYKTTVHTQNVEETTADKATQEETTFFDQAITTIQGVSVMLHDYCGKIDTKTICQHISNAETQSHINKSDVSMQTDVLTYNASMQTEDYGFYAPLRPEHLLKDHNLLRLYTGIPNAAVFNAIFDECKSHLGNLKDRKRVMRPVDEFLLTLIRLRMGLPMFDLAFRFSISKATASRAFSKWVDLLYSNLSCLIYWPTKEQIANTMPQDFKNYFSNTRIIIDCTELEAQSPESLQHKSLMYSNYKSHMTWKALVGVTPNGVVSFVSDLWAGSISDKQIVAMSGLIDILEEGDAVMGDKGFLISDLTTPKQINLIIPPRKQKKIQMSTEEVMLTRRIANCRIHVERHMERVKNFKILKNLLGTMKEQSSKIWKICNILTTLQKPLHCHNSNTLHEEF